MGEPKGVCIANIVPPYVLVISDMTCAPEFPQVANLKMEGSVRAGANRLRSFEAI
jgi:hypothetical protein